MMMPTDGTDPARPAVPVPDAPPADAPDRDETDALIDEMIDESFPASDPPPTSGSRAGTPKRKKSDGGTPDNQDRPPAAPH
jgi:hypothetical protein